MNYICVIFVYQNGFINHQTIITPCVKNVEKSLLGCNRVGLRYWTLNPGTQVRILSPLPFTNGLRQPLINADMCYGEYSLIGKAPVCETGRCEIVARCSHQTKL